jgi:hypothetical protein
MDACYLLTDQHYKQGVDVNKLAIILPVLVLSSGCASMFNGSKETIYVRSNVDNTVFYANAREIGRGTSAVTTIPKKQITKTTLRAEKEGCVTQSTPIITEFDWTTLLGIPIDFGIVSIIIVDGIGTGAINKASQTEYVLTPLCN